MLRALVVGLILLNALFYGWTQGWLDAAVGIKARGDREPERVARQLHPERVQVLTAQPAARSTAAGQTRFCQALGPLDGATALAAATAALAQAGIGPGDWQERLTEQPGVWAVATIRMPSKEFQARKEATYTTLKLPYEFLPGPPEEMPSLVLSRHPSEKAAAAALENFSQRALKGLRVLPLQAAIRRHSLVFAKADPALQTRLAGLMQAGPLAASFRPCAEPTADGASTASQAASPAATPAASPAASTPPPPAATPSARPG